MIVKAEAIYRKGAVEFKEPRKAPPDGTSIVVEYEAPRHRSFVSHFGVLSREEGQQMQAAIEEGCERVDRNEW